MQLPRNKSLTWINELSRTTVTAELRYVTADLRQKYMRYEKMAELLVNWAYITADL